MQEMMQGKSQHAGTVNSKKKKPNTIKGNQTS